MKALDLFCCAGGASMGLSQAGFDVTGVDIRPQPKYPFRFIQADALRPPLDLRAFDFVWASPPCQAFTTLRALQRGKEYPNLIPQTREMLVAAGVPFAIENVEGAPLGVDQIIIRLCGTMFGLETPDGAAELRRHRLFETSFSIPLVPECRHGYRDCLSVHGSGGRQNNRLRHIERKSVISVHGGHARDRRRAVTVTGNTPQTNVNRNRDRRTFSADDARAAMGIDWMSMRELSQAIPPAYAQFIGEQAIQIIRGGR